MADVFIQMGYPFDSEEAQQLNKQIFETMYHGALEASNDIAKKRMNKLNDNESITIIHEETKLQKYKGAYSSYEGSPISQGIYQFDMWGVEVNNTLWDWDELKTKISQYGIRNSLLLAPMPTASTSQIMGFNECFEPFTSNLYKRKTLAGEFIMLNKYLVKDLIEKNLWSRNLKEEIIINEGSIQNIEIIPDDIKSLYKTVWEIKQKVIIDMASDRGAFICQSQSMNLFVETPEMRKLTQMHFYAWQKGLKTGMYYLRTKPRANAQQFTIDPSKAKSNIQSNETTCESCSA